MKNQVAVTVTLKFSHPVEAQAPLDQMTEAAATVSDIVRHTFGPQCDAKFFQLEPTLHESTTT